MLAIAAVILAARLVGALIGRLGQPPVMGEVLAGILLGPTLLGTVAPPVKDYLFPPDIVPLLGAAASIGLAFYMFLVGLELDPRLLRGRVADAAFISNASVAVPLAAGFLIAVPLYDRVADDIDFAPFAAFMGVSMSITAFPVLARILVERRMLKKPVGVLALAAAAVDDVTAWGLLALASALAASGSGLEVIRVFALAALFCGAMALIGRPLLGRVSVVYDEAGHIPHNWVGAIFVGVLLSAYVSWRIGIAAIFGAFVMGLIMPRRADLSHDVTNRLEDFVVTVLLPLFFVVTGLRTDVGSLDRPVLWVITVLLIGVAVLGKWGGAFVSALMLGYRPREAAALGALINTRGLTELIVLNIGLGLQVITPALFTMLVLMALATTFSTAPSLRIIDPQGQLTSPPEDELRATQPSVRVRRERALIIAPQDEKNLDALLALAAPLASSEPRREVIIVRLVPPKRLATGLATEDRELSRITSDLEQRRADLSRRGLSARQAVFTSAAVGSDLLRLASEEDVDLVLLDGHRPLLGDGIPRADVGFVLEHAPSDVAVFVERGHTPAKIDQGHPIVVPFGGAEHDWAALELAAWLASSESAPLRLLGREAQDEERDASRLLANASLVVQRLTGVAAEPVLVPRGREGILQAATEAGLLIVGLSDRWRQEGLGPVRQEIVQKATAPTLIVRRGRRPGALAPATSVTRFTWSTAHPRPAGTQVVGPNEP